MSADLRLLARFCKPAMTSGDCHLLVEELLVLLVKFLGQHARPASRNAPEEPYTIRSRFRSGDD